MNCPFNSALVVIRVTINNLYFSSRVACVRCCEHALKRGGLGTCVSDIIHFQCKSNLGTRMRYICCSMLVVIIPKKSELGTKRVGKNKQKVTTARSLPLRRSPAFVKTHCAYFTLTPEPMGLMKQ